MQLNIEIQNKGNQAYIKVHTFGCLVSALLIESIFIGCFLVS